MRTRIFFAILLYRLIDAEPPRVIPSHLENRFTMSGRIPLTSFYVDDSGGNGTFYKYSNETIESYINSAATMKRKYLRITSIKSPSDDRSLLQTPKKYWIFEALQKYPLPAHSAVAVLGSMEPWYEAVALVSGAKTTTTIEYNRLLYDHPNMSTMQVRDMSYDDMTNKFDAALSISSFDHDGLGRYGDPIDPSADLKAMQNVWRILRPNGLLYLAVPIGPDLVVWNLHRRYGPLRLPMLLKSGYWEVIGRIAWNEQKLHAKMDHRKRYEPIIVLRKIRSDEL